MDERAEHTVEPDGQTQPTNDREDQSPGTRQPAPDGREGERPLNAAEESSAPGRGPDGPADVRTAEPAPAGQEQDRGGNGAPRARLLNARDATEYLGISLSTLNRIEKRGLLVPFRTPGGHRRYAQSMLDEYLEATRKPPTRDGELAGD